MVTKCAVLAILVTLAAGCGGTTAKSSGAADKRYDEVITMCFKPTEDGGTVGNYDGWSRRNGIFTVSFWPDEATGLASGEGKRNVKCALDYFKIPTSLQDRILESGPDQTPEIEATDSYTLSWENNGAREPDGKLRIGGPQIVLTIEPVS